MRADLWQDLLALLGAALVIVGLVMISIPLALIAAGVGSLTTAWLWARTSKAAPPPSGGR